MARKNPPTEHPPCPKCDMGMVVTNGYNLDWRHQTFECLRCGHIDLPAEKIGRKQAAE
jgi:uncharacterized paraquat-inducible protein A